MISNFLKEISARNQAVKDKKYIDSNGDVYIGQKDGRLLLDINNKYYTKAEIDAIINNVDKSISNITNIFANSGIGSVTNTTVTSAVVNVIATSGLIVILCDTSLNNIVVNIPSAIANTARYTVKKTTADTNTVTVTPFGAQTIDGGSVAVLQIQDESIDIVSDNSNLKII